MEITRDYLKSSAVHQFELIVVWGDAVSLSALFISAVYAGRKDDDRFMIREQDATKMSCIVLSDVSVVSVLIRVVICFVEARGSFAPRINCS